MDAMLLLCLPCGGGDDMFRRLAELGAVGVEPDVGCAGAAGRHLSPG